MQPRSPTLAGFRAMLQRPSVGLAEIAWRWSFGAACGSLVLVSCIEYLDTLPVDAGDLLLLRTRQPALISHAMARLLSGGAVRAIEALVVLAVTLSLAWMGVASLGRAATIKSLLAYFRQGQAVPNGDTGDPTLPLASLWGLNFLRVAVTLAACVGGFAAFLVGGEASPATNSSPAAPFLLVLSVLTLVWFSWSVVNWFLSVAAVFVVVKARNTFAAIASAVDLIRHRPGSVFAAGIWFGLAHIAVFLAATSIAAFPWGLAEFLPRGAILGAAVSVTLLYFAAVDFLYIGRLAAYVEIVEWPGTRGVASTVLPLPGSSSDSAPRTISVAVDPDELILSDTPFDN
jgi:hypothetical protein